MEQETKQKTIFVAVPITDQLPEPLKSVFILVGDQIRPAVRSEREPLFWAGSDHFTYEQVQWLKKVTIPLSTEDEAEWTARVEEEGKLRASRHNYTTWQHDAKWFKKGAQYERTQIKGELLYLEGWALSENRDCVRLMNENMALRKELESLRTLAEVPANGPMVLRAKAFANKKDEQTEAKWSQSFVPLVEGLAQFAEQEVQKCKDLLHEAEQGGKGTLSERDFLLAKNADLQKELALCRELLQGMKDGKAIEIVMRELQKINGTLQKTMIENIDAIAEAKKVRLSYEWLEGEHKKHLQAYAALDKRFQQVSKEVEVLETSLASVQADKRAAQAERNVLREEKEGLQREAKRLSEEKEKVDKDYIECAVAHRNLAKAKEALGRSYDDLLQDSKRMISERDDCLREKQQLEKQLEEYFNRNPTYADLLDERDRLQKELGQAKSDLISKQQELTRAIAEVKSLRSEHRASLQEWQAIHGEKEVLLHLLKDFDDAYQKIHAIKNAQGEDDLAVGAELLDVEYRVKQVLNGEIRLLNPWRLYPEEKPEAYGTYEVYRAGCQKQQYQTWNNTGWAYDNNDITHFRNVLPPTA